MPKGAKKRAKKKQGPHPADSNGGGGGNNNNGSNNSNRRVARDGNHLQVRFNIPPVDVHASEDSIESSEDMVTPRADDKEEKKAASSEVVRGPAVALAAAGHRATWWNCCGIFDALAGSER